MKSLLDQYVTETFGRNRNESYYDLDESEQDMILAQIRAYATANKLKFLQEVRDLDPQDESSPLALIYEALANAPDNWGDFFSQEIKRIMDLGLTLEKPENVFAHLYELIFNLENRDAPHLRMVLDTLGQYLETTTSIVRREALYLINGILDINNSNQYPALVSTIKALLKDPDWRVRYLAFSTLKDAGALSESYQLPFLDRLRRQFQSPYK